MQIMNLDRLIIGHALSFAKHVSLDRQPHAPVPKVRWYFGTENSCTLPEVFRQLKGASENTEPQQRRMYRGWEIKKNDDGRWYATRAWMFSAIAPKTLKELKGWIYYATTSEY